MPLAAGRTALISFALVLVLVVMVFAVLRVATDAGNLTSGRLPDRASLEYRYAAYPWLAYAHIAPAVVYLLLAPLQLWRGFRSRQLAWHRRIGRIAVVAGILGGVGAVVFGTLMPFSGLLEASASAVFGSYLALSLWLAYRAIRRGRVRVHRRWMIRAFAVGLGAATIRIWAGLFEGFGILPFQQGLGVAFWLGFTMHAFAAELWLRWRPTVPELSPQVTAARAAVAPAPERT